MKSVRLLLSATLLVAAPVFAQDKVTLSNGDVLSGKLGTMADGKLTIKSPVLGDVVVPFEQVATIATQGTVEIVTKNGERVKRRIVGIDLGKLQLATGEEGGPAAPTITLDQVAQLNPPEHKPPAWTGSLTVNASLAEGNTNSRTAGLSLEASQRRENDRINFYAAWDYGEDKVGGVWQLNQRRAGAGIKYDYFRPVWYALATTRVLGDTMADLDLRLTAGMGLGYQLVETETLSVLIEAGPSDFYEDYRSATPSQDYLAARAAYKVNWRDRHHAHHPRCRGLPQPRAGRRRLLQDEHQAAAGRHQVDVRAAGVGLGLRQHAEPGLRPFRQPLHLLGRLEVLETAADQ